MSRPLGLTEIINLLQGDITDLNQFKEETFSFVVCVGDSISYVLEKGPQAIRELVRVAGERCRLGHRLRLQIWLHASEFKQRPIG